MKRILTLAFLFVCVAAVEAEAQKITVLPKGPPYFADDVIEVTVDLGKRDDTWVSDPRNVETSNLDVEMNDWATDHRVKIQMRLTPRGPGPASIGPAEFHGRDGRTILVRVPRMTFEILPALDDGSLPVDEVFEIQRRNKRPRVAIRPEVEGSRSLDSLLVVRWVLYSEGPTNIWPGASLDVSNAKDYHQSGSGAATWTAIGGTPVMKKTFETAVIRPIAIGAIESEPRWVTVMPATQDGGPVWPTRARRIAVMQPIVIGERRSELPTGSFEIECANGAVFTRANTVRMSVSVAGDGDLSGAVLRIDGAGDTPFLLGDTGLSDPVLRDGRVRTTAHFSVFASPVPADQGYVDFPKVTFDSFDPIGNRKVTLSCEAGKLKASRESIYTPSPPKREAKDLPAEASVVFNIFEGAGALFVLFAIFGLWRAITRP